MKKSITAIAISGLLTATIAQADDAKKVWGGGDPSGSAYSGIYVPHIIEKMADQRLAGYEWAGVSDGTVYNAEQVTNNPTHVAVGQNDILKNLNGQEMPGGGTYDFTVLHDNIGPECMYAVTDEAGYETFGHILSNAWDLMIYTGSAKSGSFGTLQILQELYPSLSDAVVEHAGDANDIIAAVKANEASFGFFVMRPDPNSAVFKAIADSELTLVPVVDFELEGVYDFLELKIAAGGLFSDAAYHTTSCTSVSMITGVPANAEEGRDRKRVEETIKRVGSISAEDMTPSTKSWRDMFDSIKAVSGAKAKELMEKSKEALAAAGQ